MPVKPFGVPPAEAIKLIKAKGFNLHKSFDWRDTWADTHAAAFTVAKSAGFDVLGDIYGAVLEAQEGKLTYKEFLAKLQPTLEQKGWWGRKTVFDPEAKRWVPAQLGSPRRVKTIYRTNLRQAEAAGQWTKIQALKDKRPFLRYVCVLDQKTREEHKAWHGLILPVDHPFWDTHFPPNDWGCRCKAMSLSQDQMDRWDWKPSDGGAIPFNGLEPWQDERNGVEMMVPQGVHPAFAHNPGKVAIDVHAAQALGHTLTNLPPAVAAQAAAASADFIAQALDPQFQAMFKTVFEKNITQDRRIVVGALSPKVLDWLETEKKLKPASGAISLIDKDLGHLARDFKRLNAKALNEAELKILPYILARPQAILYETDTGVLLYVFDSPSDPRRGKIVVEVDAVRKLPVTPGVKSKKEHVRLNYVKAAGLVDVKNLTGPKFEKVAGSL